MTGFTSNDASHRPTDRESVGLSPTLSGFGWGRAPYTRHVSACLRARFWDACRERESTSQAPQPNGDAVDLTGSVFRRRTLQFQSTTGLVRQIVAVALPTGWLTESAGMPVRRWCMAPGFGASWW